MILGHPDARKRVDAFALSIYGLVIFPKALGHVDEATSDLFDRLDKRVTPVLAILAETFSHFWKIDKVSYRVFSENYSPLKEIVATPRRDDISEEKWLSFFKIFVRRTSSGEPHGCFQMKYYTDVVTLIGSCYLESGERLVMLH
ncbi:hypothetical protein Gotur_034148 [Gossypium turneri]